MSSAELTAPLAPAEVTSAGDRQAGRQALAELERTRARLERDHARALEDERERLVAQLLPVLDNLDRSIAAGAGAGTTGAGEVGQPAGDDPLVEGVRMVRAQLAAVLRGYGLERFDAVGARFDPRDHDAVATREVADPADDGVVVEQWEPGYRAQARVLRPARVVVGTYRPRAAPAPNPGIRIPVRTA